MSSYKKLRGAAAPVSRVCLPHGVISDGLWHTVKAYRYGHQLMLEVDDADQHYRRNETLLMLSEEARDMKAPHRLLIDKQDGISMGGKPYFAGINVINVEDDFYESKKIIRIFILISSTPYGWGLL